MPGCGFAAESESPPVCDAATLGALAMVSIEVYEVVTLMSKIPRHILKAARDRNFAVTVRVGKSGLTENILNEISEQLSARGMVKIKFNRGIFSNEDKELSIEMICTQCNATLVDAKGNVVIVYHP